MALTQYLIFMAINHYKLLTILFLSNACLIQFGCKKLRIDCTQVKYDFILPVKAFPNKDLINIGDTIFLEINENVSFIDSKSGQTINFNGAENLGSALGFQKYDSVSKNWSDAVSLFSFYLIKGVELKVTSLDIQYRFIEENGAYVFKLAVIPKQKGLQRLVFSNSNNTYQKTDKCTKANFTINFKETNHNRHLVGYAGPDVPGGDLNFYVK